MPSKYASGVYKISNLSNGKIYIGSSKALARRFAAHKAALRNKKHQNKHLQFSWDKHGEAMFEFSPLIICSEQNMRFYEQSLMDAWNPEYNQSKSAYAGVPLGSSLTEGHKEKVRIATKLQWEDESYRTKVVAAINAAMSPKECNERSRRTKQLWAKPEYRAKAIAARKGNAYNKGYKCTPEQIQNRKKAARISNMKRNYGSVWKQEYATRYPKNIGDLNGY